MTQPTLNAICRHLAAELGVPTEDLFSRRKFLPIARLRALAMAVGMDVLRYGPVRTGLVLQRNHSTVIHGADVGRRLMQQPKFAQAVDAAIAKARAEQADTARRVSEFVRRIKPTNRNNLAA